MNEEIKKILGRINKEIKKHIEDGYSEDMLVIYELDVIQWRILLNYITNLQKENENLKERCDYLQRSCDRKEEQRDTARAEYMEQEDYKQRNEKAIEYIENHTENIDRGTYYEDYVETYDLLNILVGGDE